MPTHYEMILPHSLRAEGNNFMGVVGASLADLSTFYPNPRYRRIDNHSLTFHVSRFQDEFNFEGKIAAPLVAPPYDSLEEYVDVSDAQALLVASEAVPTSYDPFNDLPFDAPTSLIIGREIWGIESLYGLELIPEE